MDSLHKLWNYSPDPKLWKSLRMRAFRGLCVFLVLMLCLTVISRAADSLTVPIVSVQQPKTTSLVHTVKVDGVLEAVEQVPLMTVSGALVKSLHVSPGDSVREGDLLFSFDTAELEHQIKQSQLELNRAYAQLRAQQDADEKDAQKEGVSATRAQEDYRAVDESTDIDAAAAGDAVRVARRALNDFDGDKEDDDYKGDLYTLRAGLRSAELAYEKALLEREEKLKAAQRAIDDAQESAVTTAQTDLLAIDCQLRQLELDRLREYAGTGGDVYAPMDGVVGPVSVAVGGVTGNEAALFLTGTGNLKFTAQLTEIQQKRVAQGSPASLELYGSSSDIRSLRVSSVGYSAQKNSYEVEVELPAGTAVPGTGGELTISQKSAGSLCVPLSAVYSDGPRQYVLTAWEAATAMGNEWTVQRVNVTVTDSNESYAAVSGLSGDALVVADSDRTLAGGSRVRIQEAAS